MKLGGIDLKLKEIKCSNCGKEIYIQQPNVREKMFCTLGCLISYKDKEQGKVHN